MKTWISFIFAIILLHTSHTTPLLDLIENILDHHGRETIILAFVCQKFDALQLLRAFGSSYQINILPLTATSLEYPFPPNRILYVLDLKCSNSSDLLQIVQSERLFSSPFKWLMYLREIRSIEDVAEEHLSGIDVLIDSDVTLATMQDHNNFVMKKIYKRRTRTAIIYENVEMWTSANESNFKFDNPLSRKRRDLMGTILNTCIVITHNDSLNHLTDKRDIHIDSIAKVNYVLVEHLSNIVNATLNYSIQSSWGYRDSESKWSGMIGELTRGESDIGGTALFVTSDRIAIIDYIAMTTPTRSKFIFRQPKLSYVSNVYTLPFDELVWTCTFALILIVSAILHIAIKWEWKKKSWRVAENASNETEVHDSWLEVIFISFGAMCQQGSSSMSFSLPGRITLFSLFLSFMFLYTSYAANIVALLQSSSNSIRTLKDLLQSRLDVGVDDTVFNHFYFPTTKEPVRQALYREKVAPPGQKPKFYPIEYGVAKMRQGLFAFHAEMGPAYKLVSETFREDEKCGIKEIQFLQVPDPWLAIQKNSSYKKLLKTGLLLLQENGIQGREVGLIYTRKPQCTSRGSSFISVGMVDCYPAAAVLAVGLAAGVLILLLEIFVSHRLQIWINGKMGKIRVMNKNDPNPSSASTSVQYFQPFLQ